MVQRMALAIPCTRYLEIQTFGKNEKRPQFAASFKLFILFCEESISLTEQVTRQREEQFDCSSLLY